MELIHPVLEQYCEKYSKVFHSELLDEVERFTHLHQLKSQMISSKLQGQLLSFLSNLIQPEFILEIGTFTGYSALCLSTGLKKNGKLITIESNPELEDHLRRLFNKSPKAEQIELILGDACSLLSDLNPTLFDLIYIDADKLNYDFYYETALKILSKNGCILIDNMLWHGKVAEQPIKDNKTLTLHHLNEKISSDTRVENILLPFRDGIQLIRKI